MPDEPIPPASPPPSEPPGLPPPDPPLLPAPHPSRWKTFGRFSGGCLIVVVVAFAVFSLAFDDMHHLLGCAALQLVYIVPAVIWLLRTQKKALAYGMIFAGAVVLLLGSVCGPLDFK